MILVNKFGIHLKIKRSFNAKAATYSQDDLKIVYAFRGGGGDGLKLFRRSGRQSVIAPANGGGSTVRTST